jgi:hypothetical protein
MACELTLVAMRHQLFNVGLLGYYSSTVMRQQSFDELKDRSRMS